MSEIDYYTLYKTDKGMWDYNSTAAANINGESVIVAAFSMKQALYCAYNNIRKEKGRRYGITTLADMQKQQT